MVIDAQESAHDNDMNFFVKPGSTCTDLYIVYALDTTKCTFCAE